MRLAAFRLGLTSKIFAVGAIGSLGLMTVGGLYLYGEATAARSQSVADNAITARAMTRATMIQMLEARRAEKDFIIRSEDTYIKRHGAVTQTVNGLLDSVNGKLVNGGLSGPIAKLNAIRSGFELYQKHFAALADAKIKLGLNENLGLEGKLRASVHAVETALAERKEIRLTSAILTLRRHEKDFMLRRDAKYVDQLKKAVTEFDAHLSQSDLAAADKQDIGKKIADYQRDFLAYAEGMTAVLREQKAMSDQYSKIDPIVVDLEKEISAVAGEAAAEASTIRERAGMQMQLALVIVIIGATAISLLVARSVTRPIKGLSAELHKLSGGDFNISLPWRGKTDEIGEISRSVDLVVRKVGATIANVKVASSEVSGASAEISTATTDLSQRTEEQAASLEQTSASMEQITSTVKRTAENALRASELAENTCRVASRGGEVVAETVKAMGRIEESSGKITDIIGVIDEVARQTNLLALNAAVEAARAGEAGRGFAVVASEVRSLAQRSSQAAKDIKELITNSAAQVKAGVDLVASSGSVLKEIVDSIKDVSHVIADIASASQEQSTGVDEINKALVTMDEVTQQNSALVEENAATAKTLEHQAKAMDEQVAFFRIGAAAGAEGITHAKVVSSKSSDDKRAVIGDEAKSSVAAATVPAAAPMRALAAGGARQMQTKLATAVKNDEWKEF